MHRCRDYETMNFFEEKYDIVVLSALTHIDMTDYFGPPDAAFIIFTALQIGLFPRFHFIFFFS